MVEEAQRLADRLFPAAERDPFPWCDCAHVQRGSRLELLSVDSFARGVQYPAAVSPRAAGAFAVNAALSDIAACGGEPRGLLLSVALPRRDARRFDPIVRGALGAAFAHGAPLLGGDTKQADAEQVTVTAVGEAPFAKHLGLDGARPGDALLVTGPLGGPAAAVRLAASGAIPLARLERVLLGVAPRFAHGRLLGGRATSATDLSDGLSRALHILARRSRCGFEVGYEALPAHPLVAKAAAGRAPKRPAHGLQVPFPRATGEALRESLLLHYGGEYELVATVPPARLPPLLAAADAAGLPFHRIGRVTEGPGVFLHARGESRRLPEGGWEHFK